MGHLVANDDVFSVGRPSQREGLSQTSDFIEDNFILDVPKSCNPITAHTTKLKFFGRVESNLFNGCRMSSELC
ncbi:hypothetical protein RRF57_010455 [Xylaria bambusicola]|uniref:Uncharacterized protein n=1 Tax=Xylaria bambusicola TaxID=326684 RepID=A0AAN7Z8I4_9PEZI